MNKKMVSFDAANLPPLTEKQLHYLAGLTGAPVDTTDIPELTDAELAQMRPAHSYRPVKRQITARVDADVLDWLRSQGKGYQSRINAILRRAMLDQQGGGR